MARSVRGSNYPLLNPTWYEAVLFANLLSVQNGYARCYYKDAVFTIPVDSTNYISDEIYCDFNANGYRLLSEGEWEYAVRAGTSGPFFCDEKLYDSVSCWSCAFGLLPTLEMYVIFCANAGGYPGDACSKLPNPWNLCDMSGNVREWCWDWTVDYPGNGKDYTGPASGTHRCMRAGNFCYMARNVRSAMRGGFTPDTRGQNASFRLARSVN